MALGPSGNLDPWEDPKSRTPNSGLQYSNGVDYGTLRESTLGIRPGLWECVAGQRHTPQLVGPGREALRAWAWWYVVIHRPQISRHVTLRYMIT